MVSRAYKINTDIRFDVFIHKVDGLSDDNKIETQRDIHQRSMDDLADAGLDIHLRLVGDELLLCAVDIVVSSLSFSFSLHCVVLTLPLIIGGGQISLFFYN